jgi:hypothetical protein
MFLLNYLGQIPRSGLTGSQCRNSTKDLTTFCQIVFSKGKPDAPTIMSETSGLLHSHPCGGVGLFHLGLHNRHFCGNEWSHPEL